MIFNAKFFNELNINELYGILRSRYAVFTLEQKIYYQDMDGIDREARHYFIEDNGEIVAYLRAFRESKTQIKIGRVLTTRRGVGLGRVLMENSLEDIFKKFECKEIRLDSQLHAKGFYELFGFVTNSAEFIEAGIPHVSMVLEKL